jgi:hypothetical protein
MIRSSFSYFRPKKDTNNSSISYFLLMKDTNDHPDLNTKQNQQDLDPYDPSLGSVSRNAKL